MWILSNFDLFIFLILLLITIFPAIKAFNLLSTLIKLIVNNRRNLDRWKEGVINLDDLNRLTSKEFQIWCGEFIQKLGYTDISTLDTSVNGTKGILCKKANKLTYIYSKNSPLEGNPTFMVDDKVCRQMVGEMAHNSIKKGLIITSGVITNNAIEYINTLPKEYEIVLLEGTDIWRQYEYLHHKKYRTT